jgi:hypothetical protein
MMTAFMQPALRLRCDICYHEWVKMGTVPPDSCANKDCRSRLWNGARMRRGPKIKLPSPRKQGRQKTAAALDLNSQEEV